MREWLELHEKRQAWEPAHGAFVRIVGPVSVRIVKMRSDEKYIRAVGIISVQLMAAIVPCLWNSTSVDSPCIPVGLSSVKKLFRLFFAQLTARADCEHSDISHETTH